MGKRKKQYTLLVSVEDMERLEKLARALGTSSKADAIRQAVAIMSKLAEIEQKGGKLVIEEDGRTRELYFPGV